MKRNWPAALLAALLLLSLAACGGEGPEETTAPPVDTQPVDTQPAETVPTQEDLFLRAGEERVLAALIYSPTQEDLDRATGQGSAPLVTLDDSNGTYFDEVLVVPLHGDCTVTVEHLEWQEDGGYTASPVDALGSLPPGEGGASAGALLIRTLLPEEMPLLQVTVTRGGQKGSYMLGYDGRGDGFYCILAENGNG